MLRKKSLVVGAAALVAVATLGACGNTGSTTAVQSSVTTSASVSSAEAHNEVDEMFAQHMIPHHQQAIEMSDMLVGKQGIDQRVLDLATQIKAAQGPEIEQMQKWLTQWGTPTMPGVDMPGHGGMPTVSATPGDPAAPTHSMMPGTSGMDGMMSQEDMSALQNAQGVAASNLFLTQMIKHHEGAISMAQNEIKNGQYPAATALAQAIVTSQQKEIDMMNKILATL